MFTFFQHHQFLLWPRSVCTALNVRTRILLLSVVSNINNTTVSASLCTLIPPQEWLDRKSTGDVTPGWTGYLRRKSSSAGFISLFIRRIWRHNKQEGVWNVVFFQHKPRFLSAWLDPNRAVWSQERPIQWRELVLKKQTMQKMKPGASLPYLEGELSDVRELVTFKQASGGVLEDWGGDAVN